MHLLHPGPGLRGDSLSIFIDESRHDSLDFVLSALVCAAPEIELSVGDALRSEGLAPGVDEFKSGEFMKANDRMRRLRSRILRLVQDGARCAVLISSRDRRRTLGRELVQTLETLITRNGLRSPILQVYFDQGLFRSTSDARRLALQSSLPKTATFHFEQDSRRVLGLQVADAISHLVAQVLKEQICGVSKHIDIGGPDTGYEEGTTASLGWKLLMTVRYSFFVRPHLAGRAPTPEEAMMDPVLIPDKSDMDAIIDAFEHPELLGWGVFLGADLPARVKVASEAVFSNLWLGCIHS